MVQTQLKTRPRHTLLKLNSKEMKWTPGHIFMLYYAVLVMFASGDRTIAAYKYIDITLRKHVEIR